MCLCVHLQVLPFPKDVVAQLDYNSRLRLSLCFFRLKTLMDTREGEKKGTAVQGAEPMGGASTSSSSEMVEYKPFKLLQPGMLQNMMTEVRDTVFVVCC